MIKVTDQEYWMDGYLKSNLDSMVYDAGNDFDFVIIVTGDGMVRVGKTVIAGQAGYYLAWRLKRKFSLDHFVYSGEVLMEKAKKYPPSVFIYDESRTELDSAKTLQKVSQVLRDFFAECGKLNHIIILVMPDFFEMTKSIAISRSECLINVIVRKERVKFEDSEVVARKRGRFLFYGRDSKRLLYIKGKKQDNDYQAVKPDFYGDFPNHWVVDEGQYNIKKINFIKRQAMKTKKDSKSDMRIKHFCKWLTLNPKLKGVTNEELAKALGMSRPTFQRYLKGSPENDADLIQNEVFS